MNNIESSVYQRYVNLSPLYFVNVLAIFHVQLKSKMEDFLTNNKGLDYNISGINIYVHLEHIKTSGQLAKTFGGCVFFPLHKI